MNVSGQQLGLEAVRRPERQGLEDAFGRNHGVRPSQLGGPSGTGLAVGPRTVTCRHWGALCGPLELTSQDEVQELEGCLKTGACDAALLGVQGEEDQTAEEGQEASSYCEATGHAVAVEDAVELRRLCPVLVTVS